MPKIIGRSTRVVETPEFSIDEYAGNVGTQDDRMSVALVQVSKPAKEPWLTLDYDEWIAVLKGRIDFYYYQDDDQDDDQDVHDNREPQCLSAHAGDTVFVARGERFRPVFPMADTQYVPVCLPAFKPERCLREDDEGEDSAVATKLKELHTAAAAAASGGASACISNGMDSVQTTQDSQQRHPDTLYHMCEKTAWDAAVKSGQAYFPPTFQVDGNFTHATAVPSRLLETANHFYTDSQEEWICLQFSAQTLRTKCGIVTTFEEPKPVGSKPVHERWTGKSGGEGESGGGSNDRTTATTNTNSSSSGWVCPHVFGGIPTDPQLEIVTRTYRMIREDESSNGNENGGACRRRFLSIEGLVD